MSAPQSYYVPVDAGEAEFTEKRSRFLGHVRRVETEAEARTFLDEMRKKYYDARHNCWCYVLREGGVVRYGDDGEPQGTAGQPMLNVFQREGVENVVCVVTRYFGGVLLGAGGLVRAYTQGAVTAIDACGIGVMHPTARYMMDVPYPMLSRLEYFLKSAPVIVEDKDFSDVITLTLLVKCADEDKLLVDLTQLSEGRLEPMRFDETYMAWPEA